MVEQHTKKKKNRLTPYHYSPGHKMVRALLRRLNYRLSIREDEQRFHSVRRKTKLKRETRRDLEGRIDVLEFVIVDRRDGRVVEDNLTLRMLYYMDSLAPNRRVSEPRQSRRAKKRKQKEYRESIAHLHGPVRHLVINGVPVEARQ